MIFKYAPMRGLVASLLALAAAMPHAALADDAKSCKLVEIGQLHVTINDSRASVPVKINGKDMQLGLDSGSFMNFMSDAQVAALALPTQPTTVGYYVTGVGGGYKPSVATARNVELAGQTLHDMLFIVGGSDAGNGFLGANLLGVFDTEFDLANGMVRLLNARQCRTVNLAYWANGAAVGKIPKTSPSGGSDPHIYGEVSINGIKLNALFDTGAPTSILSLRGAVKAGIAMDGPQVKTSGQVSGSGKHLRQSWIVPVASIDLGGEVIRNTPFRVVDDDFDIDLDADLILGMDFFLSHHLLASRSNGTIYVTYNGGPVFTQSTDVEIGPTTTRVETSGAPPAAAEPKTTDDWAGRGSARLEKGDYAGAISDLTEAIRLAPNRSDLLSMRAKALLWSGHRDLAAKDIDAALAISPNDFDLLYRRASMLRDDNQTAPALAAVEKGVAATPKGSLDLMRAVSLYAALNQCARALPLIDSIIASHRQDSEYPALLNARAWNRALVNTALDGALADANAAVGKGTGEATFLDTRALVQLRRKDFAAAIADADAALAKNPKQSSSFYVRGLAKIALGQSDKAKADFAAARAISPKIDQRFVPYGLAAPDAPLSNPAQSQTSGGDDENDQ